MTIIDYIRKHCSDKVADSLEAIFSDPKEKYFEMTLYPSVKDHKCALEDAKLVTDFKVSPPYILGGAGDIARGNDGLTALWFTRNVSQD